MSDADSRPSLPVPAPTEVAAASDEEEKRRGEKKEERAHEDTLGDSAPFVKADYW